MGGINPEKLAETLSQRGHKWADADAAYYALDETKKDVLAQCVANLNDPDLADTKAERKARLLPKWKEHTEALVAARRAMNIAKVDYTTFQAYLELLRSKEATLREEMKI